MLPFADCGTLPTTNESPDKSDNVDLNAVELDSVYNPQKSEGVPCLCEPVMSE